MKKGRKFWSGDLILLKWPVILLILCLAASSALVGGVFWLRQHLRLAIYAEQGNKEQLTASIQRVEDETAVVRGHSERYGQLLASGIIGEEKRLELVEALEAIRERYKLYPLQVDIGQQIEIPLKEGESEDVGSWLSLRSSRLRLRLPLLHEGDLGAFHKALLDFGQGVFVVEECVVDRAAEGKELEEVTLKENLNAACTILWLTLQSEKEKTEEEGESVEPQP